MPIAAIKSEQDLEPLLDSNQELLLAFFVEQNHGSAAALDALDEALSSQPESNAYTVDARRVRNVAGRFRVTTIPTVLRVRGAEVLERLVGPQLPGTYATLLRPKSRSTNQFQTKAQARSAVKLYVTNACPWCRKLESYLDRHGIPYSKFDVSTDVAAARAMLRKSGQRGVPQAEIDGTMVVGFDKGRIDQLLGI